jgi:hypothetical protein
MLWCFALQVAAGAEAYLAVEPKRLSVGQAAQARVILMGDQADSPPVIADSVSVRASYVGSSSRSQMTPEGLSRYTQYNYQIIPLAAGEFEIGPVSLWVNGVRIETESVSLSVRAAPLREDENLWVENGFVPSAAWEGQVVVYHYLLASEYPIHQAPTWDIDDFSGLRAPRDGDRPQRVDTRVVDGEELQVIERWMPLVVMGSQDRDYRSPLAQVAVQTVPGQRPQTRLLIGEGTTLNVSPLPPTKEVFSGLVGEFSVSTELDRVALRAGESVLWRVQIEGNGTLESFEIPNLPEDLPVQVYDGSVTASAAVVDGHYRAKMVIERTIVAVEPGRIQLPELVLRSFSPVAGAYVDHRLSFPVLEVAPGVIGSGAPVSFAPAAGPIELLATPDPLRPLRSPMRTHRAWLSLNWPWLLGFLGLVGLAELGKEPYRALQRWRALRAAAQVLPPTAVELVRSFPADSEERLGKAERALRLAAAELGTDDSGAEARRRYESLLDRLHKVRFAGAPPENCIEEIKSFINDNAKGVA